MAVPSWLYNIESDHNDIIGYGVSSSLKEAKQNAMADITQYMSVSVESSTDISMSDINGKIQNSASASSKIKSKAILNGVKFIKVEQIGELWYIAAKYDNSPLDIKLKKLLPKDLKDEKQNSYLKKTPLFISLNKSIKRELDYRLIRKNNLWQLKYSDILLPINQDNFYKLFSNQSTNNLSIKANKKIYVPNNDMYFSVKNRKEGYISILYVEHNGKVGVLLANQKSSKDFRYPDLKSSDAFKISNPYKKSIQELYIAIYTKNRLNLDEFENVSENLLDESNYNFEKLISKLDKLNFSTFSIKIRER